jgi:hypothetical protein
MGNLNWVKLDTNFSFSSIKHLHPFIFVGRILVIGLMERLISIEEAPFLEKTLEGKGN